MNVSRNQKSAAGWQAFWASISAHLLPRVQGFHAKGSEVQLGQSPTSPAVATQHGEQVLLVF